MPNIGFNQIGGSPRDNARTRHAIQRLKEVQASGDVVLTTADGGLESTPSGLRIKVRAGEGLSVTSGGLGTVLDGDTLERSANGLKVTDATAAQRGAMLQQTNVTDAGVLIDNSGGSSGSGTIAAIGVTITDPADTPATADDLRDDLVANTLPSIATELSNLRDAIATLAEYSTALEDKINEMLAAQQAAAQMATP